MFSIFKKDVNEMVDYIDFSASRIKELLLEMESVDKAIITEHLLHKKSAGSPEEFWEDFAELKKEVTAFFEAFERLKESDKTLPREERQQYRENAYSKIKDVYGQMKKRRLEFEEIHECFMQLTKPCPQ